MKQLIRLTVNGDEREVYIDVRRSLLDVLRNDLGLMGTHRGCDAGDCGACTVHVDGMPITACLLLAAECGGAEVLTIEGLESGGELHAIQKKMVETGGIQCGFCTPGVIMSALALINANPYPTEAEVRQALAGNLCRCTGYTKIVEAVLSLGEEAR